MPVTLKLFGLCGIGLFDGKMLAVMPGTKSSGKPHRATLSVAAKECILKTADPDFIFFDRAGTQHLGWNVEKKRLGFNGASGNSKWNDGARTRLIDLDRFHSGAKIKLPSSGNFAVVELTDGALADGPEKELFTVNLDGKPVENKQFGISVAFQVDARKLEADGKPLVELKNHAGVTVNNLASVELGHNHFHHYYDDFFKEQPEKKVTIVNSGFEIFDCVPPVPLP